MTRLAIVIPAYKSIFFDRALLSIANQTNKEFTLYIGDDCSPGNLYDIVKKFENRIPIVYKYFNENLGGSNLVSHWERCIDLAKDEEWIWLFSDDDIMDPDCVENFYYTLNKNPGFDLYHFNVTKIDNNDNIIDNFHPFPVSLSSEEFLVRKLQPGYFSTVVEYVFRKSHFISSGRFQNFDMAWCSDDATWIKMARAKGIRNIEHSKVYWRTSQFNISSNYRDTGIVKRKFNSRIRFTEWIIKEVNEKKLHIEISQARKLLKTWFIKSIKSNIGCLSYSSLKELVLSLYKVLNIGSSPKPKILFLSIYKIYTFYKRLFKSIVLNRS